MSKYVYSFGGGTAEGDGKMKDVLGGKGANLAEMCRAGVPVPPGFTIACQVCNLYFDNGNRVPEEINEEMYEALAVLEGRIGKKLGDANNPLLVSVRSGAKFSMPGMMDTILNLGLNDTTVLALVKATNDERFAYDCYRRFIQMFSGVVLEIPKDEFEHVIEARKHKMKAKLDTDLKAADWQAIIGEYKKLVKKKSEKEFPQDCRAQLVMSRDAVFRSWNNDRAIFYRNMNKIPHDLGTAVNIQAMVFGNLGETSATGVGFTRNPATGENRFYGEFLVNAQGEDVVAGIRTPRPIDELSNVMPDVYNQLREITGMLENHYRDIQDFEFTVEDNKLWMLQTRNGKRTGPAAVRIAAEMVHEKLITKKEAIMRVDPAQLDQLLHPMLDPKALKSLSKLGKGLPASPGAAVGKIVFTADDAVEQSKRAPVVLVRKETEPNDIHGMEVAKGILTSRGGMTSHAAVVARGMGTPCVSGAGELQVDVNAKTMRIRDKILLEGDVITLDGSTGEVFLGKVATVRPELTGDFATLMGWVDGIRRLKVRANAETPLDAETARKFGAEGIGLCRTEHMFFDAQRILTVRQMIL
ncbi:MAG TPA: pyruvate, phosphate dikinase, partial [Bryobacteraceae bacterium]|nr:pyruvate, phosphate dikinase [Bryobacteraceae bacterium]